MQIPGDNLAPQESWTPVSTYLNNFSAWGDGIYADARYMKDAMGFVHLGGLLRVGSTAQGDMFTLPVGYRPTGLKELSSVYGSSGVKRIDIDSSGKVTLKTNASSGDFLSLADIIFRSDD